MSAFIVTFLSSLLVTLFVVRSSNIHLTHSADHDLDGPQKFHAHPVPRIGGAGIYVSLLAGTAYVEFADSGIAVSMWWLLLGALPTYLAGLAEDLTKRVSARHRLACTALSALLSIWLLQAVIDRTYVPGLDGWLVYKPVAVALTIFVVTGVANGVNIIDGFNGLASMCVLLMLLAISYVALQVGDAFVASTSLIVAGAVLGFFVWNFPAGLIFLGDGGAYLLGFMLAELGILLVHRNPLVSPICPLLLCAYPIFETVFTMYRRKFVRGVSTAAPDGIHLHSLIHRRLIRRSDPDAPALSQTQRNSLTSPYLWLLSLLAVIPSVLWWYSTPVLSIFLGLFVISYILLYWSIVRFRTPRWLVFRK